MTEVEKQQFAYTDSAETQSHNIVLEQSVSDLIDIEALVEKSETHLQNHHKAVRQALVAVFKLGLVLEKHKLVKTFHKKQRLYFPKKAKRNLFHGLITKAFEKSPREDAKSKYRQILLYAQMKNYSPESLENLLDEFGVEETCKVARIYLKGDFASQYEESNVERFDRAKDVFKSTRIGAAIQLGKNENIPVNFDGFSHAILRVTGRQIEIVAIHPNQSEQDVKASMAELIEPEGTRVRAKLKTKNLYPFFTLADIFARFVPSKSDVDAMEKAILRQSMGPFEVPDGPIDQVDTIKRLMDRIEHPLDKFERLSGLVFSCNDSKWVAEIHSTLPSFPVVKFALGQESERVSKRPPLCIFDNQADDFLHWFLELPSWKFVRNKTGFTAKVLEGKSLDVGP